MTVSSYQREDCRWRRKGMPGQRWPLDPRQGILDIMLPGWILDPFLVVRERDSD